MTQEVKSHIFSGTEDGQPKSQTEVITRTPFYFGQIHRPLFAWKHSPSVTSKGDLGIVICPPIGHEQIHSYRSMLHLADQFAARGITALRINYDGMGDSAGVDEDPDRFTAWLDSIKTAIHVLKSEHGCEKVGLLGLRIGASLAALVAEDIELACLVVWAPCEKGRSYLREAKLLSPTNYESKLGLTNTNNDIESAGFVITEQTAAQLSTLNLHKVSPKMTRIFIGGRDDLNDDFSLQKSWQAQSLVVEYSRLPGFMDMLATPHDTQVPLTAIHEIVTWVNKHNSGIKLAPDKLRITDNSYKVTVLPPNYQIGALVSPNAKEIPFSFGPQNELFGITCEPLQEVSKTRPIVIFLNAGAVYHIGVNRLYVLLARELASSGFHSLRMDIGGLGDSIARDNETENTLYIPSVSDDVAMAIKALKQDNKAEKFVVIGLCAGAYASFHAKLDLPEAPIVECILINPLTFYWKEGMSLEESPVTHFRNWNSYMKSMQQWNRWMKLFEGKVSLKNIFTTVLQRSLLFIVSKMKGIKRHLRFRKHSSSIKVTKGDLATDIQRLVADDTRLSFVFSDTDPGREILMSDAKATINKLLQTGAVSIDVIENADHTFKARNPRQQLIQHITNHIIQRYP